MSIHRKVALVHFNNSSKGYAYFTYHDLKQSDPVIVDSSNGLGLAWVINPDISGSPEAAPARSWIIGVVPVEELRRDLTGFLEFEQKNEQPA